MAIVEVCGMNPWLIEMLEEYGCREIVITQPDHRPKKKTDRRDASFLSNLLWLNRDRLIGGRRAPGMRRGLSAFLCQSDWAGYFPVSSGIRSSNMMAKWFSADFQWWIGRVHFFDASLIAM
jgi:hypothetical protein